jgi:hypothetical protein
MSKKSRIDGELVRQFKIERMQRADTPAPQDGDDPDQKPNVRLTLSFSSDTPYLRTSYFEEPWIEVLGHDDGEVDLSRLNDAAPVLANHSRYESTPDSPLALVGAVEKAWVDQGKGYANIILSRRDGMEGLLQDLEDGIVRNVSVGYQIQERTLIKQTEGQPDEYRVTSWLPMEISLVDIPADATVGLGRSHERNENTRYRVVDLPDEGSLTKGTEMSQTATGTPAGSESSIVAPVSINQEEVRQAAILAERSRQADIREAVRSAGLDATTADELVNAGVSVDEGRRAVLTKLAERSAAQQISSRADIQTVRDETETLREMVGAALLHRYDPKQALPEGARDFRGFTLIELSRDLLEKQGIRTRGMDKMQIATRAFESTSDLPAILANVANKTLRQAYLAAPRTFTAWARQSTAADFKTINRIALSDAPALEKINEAGEFKRGAVTDGKETYQLATYGKVIALSRQTIINDDLGAFTRIPGLFGAAAANLESDTVYGVLTANAVLADTVALFHTTHANLTGTGTVISVAGLDVARSAMRVQKTPLGAPLNLVPSFLIVPAARQTIASQYTSADFVSTKSADINPFKGALEVVVEARLDANSATAWYLAADPSQIDTVEYAYLEGQEGVYIETRLGFDTDGMEIKARLDFAAKAIDYRGLYKNVGA